MRNWVTFDDNRGLSRLCKWDYDGRWERWFPRAIRENGWWRRIDKSDGFASFPFNERNLQYYAKVRRIAETEAMMILFECHERSA